MSPTVGNRRKPSSLKLEGLFFDSLKWFPNLFLALAFKHSCRETDVAAQSVPVSGPDFTPVLIILQFRLDIP